MSIIEYILFSIMTLLFLGAVVVFIRFVIRPMHIHWAIVEGRKLVANREFNDSWRCRNVCRTLATARNDLEAADLWQKLRDIQEIEENWA
jgi:hypothetical protein